MKRFISAAVLLITLATPACEGVNQVVSDVQGGPTLSSTSDHAKYLRNLAEQGDVEAQAELASMYAYGDDVPQNYAEAAKWYRLAAEQRHAYAQYSLGIMHRDGLGVSRDFAEAVRWFRRAAEQGNAGAQYNLGVMYANGEGVPQDYAAAVRWYRKAAEPGDAEAQNNLGHMYSRGHGVPQDYVQAHMWFNLAATQGNKLAPKNRDIVAKKMTLSQIAEAQRLARSWRPRKETFVTGRNPAPRSKPQPAPQKRTTGSGFVVSEAGHILTNAHVAKECRLIKASTFQEPTLKVVSIDDQVDLALLKSTSPVSATAVFRGGRGVRTGESVIVAGFPLPGLLSTDLNVTTGTVSALAGLVNDRHMILITAPIQPGNSGGPVLDTSGNVVGVVVARLDALKLVRRTGRLPQNVNFAISEGTARAFLDAHDVPYKTARSNTQMPTADIAAKTKGYTILIECWE